MKKVVIVGGVAGGASCAARLRRLSEDIEITMYDRGEYVSFANCGLPYYIGNVISDKEELFIQTPVTLKERFNINVKILSEITNVYPNQNKVFVRNIATGEMYEDQYDYLVLAPGAKPIVPEFIPNDQKNIFTVRNITDSEKLKKYIDDNEISSATIIGGGYIGLEIAENLWKQGLNIQIIDASDQILNQLDSEMSKIVYGTLIGKGLNIFLNSTVAYVNNNSVFLENGQEIKSDIIILAAGVTPNVGFIKESGIELGAIGGVKVNQYMQTSFKNIYAVGDVAEIKETVTKKDSLVPLASPANKQGRVAADNIYADISNTEKSIYEGSQRTLIIKLFDLAVAITGMNEKTLKASGVKYMTTTTTSASHATYYPGSTNMVIKLVYGDDGKILGAQVIGKEGVDKRIDVIATTMKLGGTVKDLEELELAYSPVYNTAKDPVNIAGYVATNVVRGQTNVIHYDELNQLDTRNTILIDVRTANEVRRGQLKNAINIPVDELRYRLVDLPKDKNIVVYDGIGSQGYIAEKILKNNGFKNVKNLTGGYEIYNIGNKNL